LSANPGTAYGPLQRSRSAAAAALVAAMVAVLVISGTAVAGQPVGGCNDGYSLIKAKVDPKADKNGDGWICSKPIGNKGSNGFSDIDNNSNSH
jgi:hypothetical protein